MPQVSVIVLTYNPDNAKLRRTLAAAARQQDVQLEILISDDGSARKDFSFLPDYMQSLGVTNYRLLEHEENRGTVQSCRSAVAAATGEYVFLTSPGDYLFDPFVLRDFYRFAKENRAPLCFGDAVFYNADAEAPKLTRQVGVPAVPGLYDPGVSKKQIDTCFFGGLWVIGATYFRSRELAQACLEEISDTAVYMEDTPGTMFALARGERLLHYRRNMVWYEDGTGVSTGASEKWQKLLHKDLLTSLQKLKRQYPGNPYVDLAYCNAAESSHMKRLAKKALQHPVQTAQLLRWKKTPATPIVCLEADLKRLDTLHRSC